MLKCWQLYICSNKTLKKFLNFTKNFLFLKFEIRWQPVGVRLNILILKSKYIYNYNSNNNMYNYTYKKFCLFFLSFMDKYYCTLYTSLREWIFYGQNYYNRHLKKGYPFILYYLVSPLKVLPNRVLSWCFTVLTIYSELSVML